jgi:predicted NUDIX family phosphoesterase
MIQIHHSYQFYFDLPILFSMCREVGEVHLGVVFKINVNSNDVESKETDTLRIKWVDIGHLYTPLLFSL